MIGATGCRSPVDPQILQDRRVSEVGPQADPAGAQVPCGGGKHEITGRQRAVHIQASQPRRAADVNDAGRIVEDIEPGIAENIHVALKRGGRVRFQVRQEISFALVGELLDLLPVRHNGKPPGLSVHGTWRQAGLADDLPDEIRRHLPVLDIRGSERLLRRRV